MGNNCGNCKHYLEVPLLGPTCRKTGKAVSFLAEKDCFTEKDGGEVLTKVCARCHRELPITEFHRNRTRKDGYQRECKECQRELSQALYKKKQEEKAVDQTPTDPPTTKVCAKCGRELPVEMFGHTKKNLNGLKSYCKDCENENSRIYRAKKYGRTGQAFASADGKKYTIVTTEENKTLVTIDLFPDDVLLESLRKRGYTGTLTKTNQITL